ncbi:DUF4368 domain-containing protein [Irregularibacter muris]|uniref:DUF4368 domain-containing protein n=1 Tax=Irregularibacter muris TaxID=1796619 RepID=A0AAE3KZK7_9FIRM|nr:DUF4368 domain-containing protein [Irregularibacter muris]MCR1899385.1 DUF4368 domain-containing protein [Irregularibacter muris]
MDKIIVFKAEKVNGKRQQKIRIYYNVLKQLIFQKGMKKRHSREYSYANFFRLINPYGRDPFSWFLCYPICFFTSSYTL